jgi:hypothetical protein
MRSKNLSVALPDRLGPLRDNLLKGTQLTAKQDAHRQKIDAAWALLIAGYSRLHACNIIMQRLSLKKSQAYQIIDDCFLLFGDIAESRKEGLRYLMTEQLQNIAHRAKYKGDLKNQIRALEMISEINGLTGPDREGNLLPVLMPIIVSNDTSILTKDKPHDITPSQQAISE